jgi:phage head maturation protease
MTATAPAGQLAYTRATLAAPPGEHGPVEFVASQAKANRYGFALRPDGWLLESYRANPLVLWMHDPMRPPIGRADVRQVGGELRATIAFDQGDEFAIDIERRYRLGTLNAVSVGWGFVKADGSPIQNWYALKPQEIASKEVFYDLEEISAVTVPGDPRAVRAQQSLAAALGHAAAPARSRCRICEQLGRQCYACEAVARFGPDSPTGRWY